MKKEENSYTIHTSGDNTAAELLKLECTNCGGSLKLTDPTHAICPFCGQTFLIDEAKGTVININIDYENTAEVHQSINSTKKVLILFLVVIIVFVLVILGVNIAANSSAMSSSDRDAAFEENGMLMAIFCKDIFGKEYKDITDEEFASIRYIRYDSDRDVNDGFHVVKYSFTNYEDCESEEEFQDTIETWTYHSSKASWPSDFTMFTGLTRVDNKNSLWLASTRYSKEARISCIETDEVLEHVTACFQPEYVKVLHIGAQTGKLEDIDKYKNLEELVLNDHPMWGEELDITGIGSCTKLSKLYLRSGKAGRGIEELENLSGLKSLYISGVALEDSDFLREMPQLEELYTELGEDADVSMIKEVPNLKKLHFTDSDEIEIEDLLCLKQLEEVNLEIDEIEDLQKLAQLKNLKVLELELEIFGGLKDPVDMSVLAELPKLEELKISDFWDGELAGMEQVFNKQGMRVIAIGDEMNTTMRTVLILNPELLEDNPSVEAVKMAGWKSSADGQKETQYDILRHYPNLRRLDIGGCGIDNIEFIAGFQNLEMVDLQENEITDYSPLESCKRLQKIYTRGNPKSDPKLPETIEVDGEPCLESVTFLK